MTWAVGAIVITLVFAVSMLTTQVLATSPHDPEGDVTNGNPDFDIKKFGTQGVNPYVQVYGTAGGTIQPLTTTSSIFMYRLDMSDGTSFIVTSHWWFEHSNEVGNDNQYHAHHVVFTDNCITDDGPAGLENGDAQIRPHAIAIENAVLDGATIISVQTGMISVPSWCQTTTWDSLDSAEKHESKK